MHGIQRVPHDIMPRVRLFHLGDVHYPDADAERLADIKDKGFPAHLIESSSLRPLELVVRELHAELESGCDGLLIAGDLTSRGDIGGYTRCLQYLSAALESLPPERIHVVPGNHDVDRTAVDPTGHNVGAKFDALKRAWQAAGLPVLAVAGVRITEVTSPTGGRVILLSLNSSIGCGEKRHFPPEIADELERILKHFAATANPKDAFSLVGETLDTPAFEQKDIDDACRNIHTSEPAALPVVLSHHNLLPQALPRIAMYAELLNAGTARSRLLGLRRTLLYCHGHIHDNPIEILNDPSVPSSQLISISAPALNRGFNTITVEFGRKGFPLGCIVTTHRLSERDGSIERRPVRIPLHTANLDTIRRLGNDNVLPLLDVLPEAESRFKEVQKLLQGAQNQRLQVATVAEALLEAEWLGCVSLRNGEYEPQHWQIRRIVK